MLQLRHQSSYLEYAIDSAVGTGDISLVPGVLHVCWQAHVRSHVSPSMDYTVYEKTYFFKFSSTIFSLSFNVSRLLESSIFCSRNVFTCDSKPATRDFISIAKSTADLSFSVTWANSCWAVTVNEGKTVRTHVLKMRQRAMIPEQQFNKNICPIGTTLNNISSL